MNSYWRIYHDQIRACKENISGLPAGLFHGEESYGYACLTNQKQYYMENWPQIAVEKGSVDQVMMIMAGGR